ncbi:MAG: hypothetical protein IT370_10050 [Deltaproteobacteria bacterium]|nr:hypothetical protein [Deltaproteobacteria bacterium]
MEGDDQARRRVLYALLRAVAWLAERLEIPAGDAQDWIRLAYFQELRAAGLTVDEASARLGISGPTGARLSRILKTDFLTPKTEHDLPKKIAFMLWAGPMSRARMGQVLHGESPDAIDQALRVLLREERVFEQPGRSPTFAIRKAEDRLVRPGWAARLGALDSLVRNVVGVVHARFFAGSERAFARTVSFRMRRGDHEELRRFYDEKLWPFLAALEAKAKGKQDDDVEVTQLSIVWTSQRDDSDKELP